MSLEIAGGWLTLALTAVTIVGLVVVHVAPTGLNPLRDPVSQYHLTRYRPWIAVSTIAAGLAGIAAIIALAGLVGDRVVVPAVLLAIFAAARLLIPFLRMDAPGTPVTAVGRIHNVLAFLAFGAATAAAFVTGGALHDGGHPDAATWSTVFGVIAAIGSVGVLICVVTKRFALFGLAERIIYVGFLGFLLLIGVTGIAA
ncbi:DUF998 domain-containing protein [Agromyces silvae]|uniref:DUF998 domain-containing protein n=1 Tax=Agromyces silvae TaxID=3388266 RepID=UPI00280B71E5|nr:DUF998 domain-containing protein [Agromyces protaetiae]